MREGRVFLGRAEHWALLGAFVILLWGMGRAHLHVRAFPTFAVALLVATFAGLAVVVWRHRPGDRVTREGFEDAELPHTGREEDEV